MTTWQYRLVQVDDDIEIREVYLNDGIPKGHTPAVVAAATTAGVKHLLDLMAGCLDLPVLTTQDFVG